MNLAQRVHTISPTVTFIIIVIIFNIIPSTVILLTEYVPKKHIHDTLTFNDSKELYYWTLISFFSIFCIYRLALTSPSANLRLEHVFRASRTQLVRYYKKTDFIVRLLLAFSSVLVTLYALNGGLDKLLLLGTDIGNREFRFLNFNEVPRAYTAGLAVARRLLLPLIAIYLYSKKLFKIGTSNKAFYFTIALQVFASALTFARAPFLTLLVGLFAAKLLFITSNTKRVFAITGLLGSVIIIAGIISHLQYNVTDFSPTDASLKGMDFLTNRAWFVPNVVPINLTFNEFRFWSDPLLLEHSRLKGLLGLEVVGTLEENSNYVAPVGYIGDVWRNFSFLGIFAFAIFCSAFFAFLDRLFKQLSAPGAVAFTFLLIALIFYWVMGVVFSQGAIFAMALVILLPFIDKQIKVHSRYNDDPKSQEKS